MQALGLIETLGLLAAVESADAMLKAADVVFLEKNFIGGGLVTVVVTGEVSAVTAAVEAGSAAVNRLNGKLLITQHIIPRPNDELEGLIIAGPSAPSEAKETNEAENNHEETADTETSELDRLEESIPTSQTSPEIAEVNKQEIDRLAKEYGIEHALEVLRSIKVTKLRNLMRQYKEIGMSGRTVSKADKKALLEGFEKYYNKE